MPEPKKQLSSACSSKASPEQQLHGAETGSTSNATPASRISATVLTQEIATLATASPEPPRSGGRLKRPLGDSQCTSRALPSTPQSVPPGKDGIERCVLTASPPSRQKSSSSRPSEVSGGKGMPTRKLQLGDPSFRLDDVAAASNDIKEARTALKPGLNHRMTHDLDMSSDETALVSVALGPTGRLTAPSSQSDRNEGSQQNLSSAPAPAQRGGCSTVPSSQRFSSQTDPECRIIDTSSHRILKSGGPASGPVSQYRPPSDALGGNIVPKQPMPLFGRSCLAPLSSEGIGEPTPAQTVAEAQEKGEHTQVLDDAIYALDGMAPSCGLGTQRESITTLAELLSTRRGRAALRPDGMAQQILTAAAKLRGQSDPITALAASCMLASLSMSDAHPSYLASSAAAVLTSQLLQADQHDIPALFALSTNPSSTTSTSAGEASEKESEIASDPSFWPALSRALQLATEGQLGRLLVSELGPIIGDPLRSMAASTQAPVRLPRSHLPLALIAMVQATSTDSSKIHFADRVKNNLRKVKALEHLATLFASRHDSLQLLVAPLDRGHDSTNDTLPSNPITSPMPVKESSSTPMGKTGSRSRSMRVEHQSPQVSQSASDVRSTPSKTLGQVKPSPSGSVDPWDFPCAVEEVQRGSSKKKKKPLSGKTASSKAGGSQTTAPDNAIMPEISIDAAGSGSRHVDDDACAGPPFGEPCVTKLWQRILTVTTVDLLVELRLILTVLENSTFTCLQNEDDVIQMQVPSAPQSSEPLRSSTQQLSISTQGSTAPTSGCRPFLPLLVSLLRTLKPLLLPPPPSSSTSLLISDTAAISSSASRCVHSCVGLLMNLTHQHKEGVKAAVEAGALLALVELLVCACFSGHGEDDRGGGVNPDLPLELLPCRSKILNHLDLVTVCFGLLINLTSLHPENRDCLRGLSLGHLFCGSGAVGVGQAGRSSAGVVALLCSIFNRIESEEVREKNHHTGGDATARSESMSLSSMGDEDEVTAEDLHEGHQDGEAAIVQSYSAMLLGFLVVDSEDSRSNAFTLLRSGSGLSAVCSSIRRCLDFYSYTGAITDECKGSLVQLLADLAQYI